MSRGLTQIASRGLTPHGPEITTVACLAHLTHSLMHRFADRHDSDIEPLLRLQRECIKAWCKANNIDCASVRDALASLRNIEISAGYRPLTS